jgi:sialate O-acetylesterase
VKQRSCNPCFLLVSLAVLLLCQWVFGVNLTAQESPAKLKLPAILGDHMVIQRDVPFRVWGWAPADETITVTLGTATATTQADAEGRWALSLGKIPASPTPLEMTVKSGSETITLKDILLGDVWLCSGQSNMAHPFGSCLDYTEKSAGANLPEIRYFQVKSGPAEKPQDDCTGQWVVCTPATARGFSAVGYYFGREIHQSQKIPVGLIGANQGASAAQVWVGLDTLSAQPALKKSYIEPVQSVFDDPAAAKAALDQWKAEGGAQYEKDRAQWNQDRYAALQKKEPFDRPAPTPPRPAPRYFTDMISFPTALYNGRIHPLRHFPIRGALWYQGESNANDPLYDTLLTALIRNWREIWQLGDFPFLIVQLPNKSKQQKSADDPNAGWAGIRERQLRVQQTVPNVGLAVAIDLGSTESPDENVNLHPPEKANIGQRLALAARHFAYSENLVYSGPLVEKSEVVGHQIRVQFGHAGDGLKIGTPPPTSLTPPPPTDELRGFSIAGPDKKFVSARASIEGKDTVLVWSDAIPEPAFVRYGWQMSPVVNLYNSANLPASPFRTDGP